MIVWFALFLLVLAASVFLAYFSMSDFQEIPQLGQGGYGLFLIRQTRSLTQALLDSLHKDIVKEGLIISLERLFKGQMSALVIFAPRKILVNYTKQLDLLELEDYTQVSKDDLTIWEVGVKNPKDSHSLNIDNFFENFPKLSDTEQFWWQLTLKAQEGKTLKMPSFISQIRAVVLAKDQARRKSLAQTLQNLTSPNLRKIPRPFSNSQMIDFYKQRTLGKEEYNPYLTAEDIVKLTLLPHLPH